MFRENLRSKSYLAFTKKCEIHQSSNVEVYAMVSLLDEVLGGVYRSWVCQWRSDRLNQSQAFPPPPRRAGK